MHHEHVDEISGTNAGDATLTAATFAQLAMEMHEAGGVEETVQAVVDFALHALHCDYAGVALRTADGRPEVPAVTDPVVAEIYNFQLAGAEGALVQCMRDRSTVRVPDTVQEFRWPEWSAKVLELGVHSVLDVPLWAGGGTVGVLGLYSKQTNAFGADEEAIAYILARHAAVAVATARREENLSVAVDARGGQLLDQRVADEIVTHPPHEPHRRPQAARERSNIRRRPTTRPTHPRHIVGPHPRRPSRPHHNILDKIPDTHQHPSTHSRLGPHVRGRRRLSTSCCATSRSLVLVSWE